MSVLGFGNRISGPAWAGEVAKLKLGTQAEARTSGTDVDKVEIDLSSARSADFLVLGRLLLLIQALSANGVKIVVRMPSGNLLAAERGYLDDNYANPDAARGAVERQIARHQRQRINCRLFIEQSGFESAMRAGPLRDRIIDIAEVETNGLQQERNEDPDVGWDQHDKPHTPQRRRGIIPYRWIDLSSSSAQPSDVTDQFFRSIKGLGLPPDDAEALAQGILGELIENSRDHAYSDSPSDAWILIGGELTQPESYSTRIDDFDQDVQGLVAWASREPSPILRLFVGDFGIGIEAASTQTQNRFGFTVELIAPHKQKSVQRSSGDAILEALDRHASHVDFNRDARGLWKAKRVVRSFQGSFLVTSRSATAGVIYGASSESQEVNTPSPAWLPGTIVESMILTAPSRAIRPDEEEAVSPPRSLAQTATRLFCVTATLYPNLGLDIKGSSAVQHQLNELRNIRDGGLVVAVEVSPGAGSAAESDIENAISSVLDIASKSASSSTVVLVFAGVSRRLLKLAIDSVNGRQESASEMERPRFHSPILVVSPENSHYWVGGTLLIRQLLSILSQSAETRLRIYDAADSLNVNEYTALEQQIRDQPQLLYLDKGVITLRLRPRDALDALTAYFSEKISDAVCVAEAPGVMKGSFLTTSLRVTTRWINSRDLLRHLCLYQMAGLLLANAAESGTRPVTRSAKPRVICAGSVDEQIASAFSLALSGVANTIESMAALRVAGEPALGNPDQPIVVCTDVMSRGAYVRRTVRELWDMGFTKVSVATLIDGRDLGYVNESRGFLRVRDREVPLASLAFVSLDPDLSGSGRKPLPIDPVTGTPLPVVYPHSQAIGKQQLYREAIRQSGAARLGHIHRTGRKHFTAYVNASTIFDYEPWRDQALKRIAHYVERDNQRIGSADESPTVAVIYPSETKDDFTRVISELTVAIGKTGVNCLDPIIVPRSLVGGEWAFPRFVRLPSRITHIVAVDSTAKTGRTLRELIRLASVPGVRFISCFGLILGMNDLAAMSLQQVCQVTTYSPENPSSRVQHQVPVEVRYLVRTAVSGEDAGQCPVCGLQHTYTSLPSALPKSMSEHRLRLGELLALRSKESVFEELATDVFGVPLTQQGCIDFLERRSDLEEARFSTANRAAVVEKIASLAQAIDSGDDDKRESRERDALVRLIAAEHSRLDQAPMWFTTVRGMLVQIARSLLAAPHSRTSDPMLRIQALVMLSRADRHLFCDEYAEIVRMCRDHETVLAHALLEALALLADDWRNADWRGALAEQISVLLNEVENEQAGQSVWAFRPTEELTYLAEFASRRRRLPPNSKQQAWAELRNFCDSLKRHKYDQALWRLQRRLENSGRELPASSRANAFKDWQQCSSAIEESILPSLTFLRGILGSDKIVERRLSSTDERRRWRHIVDGGGPEELNQTTVAVGKVFIGNEYLAVAQEERDNLKDVVARWANFFFQSLCTSDNPVGISVLADIVEQCPADVLGGLRDVFDGSEWDLTLHGIRDDEPILVFCSSAALLDAITHIQMNAEITHRKEAQSPRFQINVSAPGPTRVAVELLNSGTSRDSRGGGRGLRTVAESLAKFDCRLETIEELPPGLTYGVRLVFERWKWR